MKQIIKLKQATLYYVNRVKRNNQLLLCEAPKCHIEVTPKRMKFFFY